MISIHKNVLQMLLYIQMYCNEYSIYTEWIIYRMYCKWFFIIEIYYSNFFLFIEIYCHLFMKKHLKWFSYTEMYR